MSTRIVVVLDLRHELGGKTSTKEELKVIFAKNEHAYFMPCPITITLIFGSGS